MGRFGRLVISLAVGVIAAVAGGVLFVAVPDSTYELLGIVLALLVTLAGVKLGSNLGASVLAEYDVAEVAVEGPITRDSGSSPLSSGPIGTAADDIVEQIDRADEDGNVDALLVKLNTPGGEIVPSDDIRRAVARFDGPTIGYATDVCASGGIWIATGCDELWAREESVVGSIGVRGSQYNATELADRIGISYERFVAGEFKDAGSPLKELEPEEREYIQGRIDDYYDRFVANVAEGMDLDEETIRDTEARVYLGSDARELGIVDDLGTGREVENRVAERLGVEEVTVRQFAPDRRLTERLRGGAATVAYAFGAGVAGAVVDTDEFRFR